MSLLPVNTLRQISTLFPARAEALDDWQRGFVQEQLLSQRQHAALEKALAAMQQKEGRQ